MKQILLVFSLLFFALGARAQTLPPLQPEQDACGALTLCGGSFYTPYSYSGPGAISEAVGCSYTESGSVWFKVTVATAGDIVFQIKPLDTTNDYDFSVYNITNGNCNQLPTPIRCNANTVLPLGSIPQGIVGLNYTSTLTTVTAGSAGNPFLQSIAANVGDVFLIVVDNFSATTAAAAGFTIDFAGSTATFVNGTPPMLGAILPACSYSSKVVLTTSKPVKCSSLASNGSDFTVTPGGTVSSASGKNCTGALGYTSEITVNFASPLPAGSYNLNAAMGSDGNTLLDICDNALALPASLPFAVSPYANPGYSKVVTPSCSEVRIALNKRVKCDSIAANGSDFVLTGPGAPQITGVYGYGCDSTGYTDTVVLILSNPLLLDGTYTVTAQKGSDNNTLLDSCGNVQAVGDAVSFSINSFDGKLTASSSQPILCEPGYLQLNSTNTSTPPDSTLNDCGLVSATPGAPTGSYFAAGRDSLSTLNSPFYELYPKGRRQYLYRAAELRRTGLKRGLITSLSWNVVSKNTSSSMNGFTIKMGCTNVNQLNSGFIGGPQTVFNSPNYATVLGVNQFNFTTPFYWDGQSNIVIEVCYDNTNYDNSDRVAHSVTNFQSVYHLYGYSGSGCALTTSTGYVLGNNTLRPKTRFYTAAMPKTQPAYIWTPASFVGDSTAGNTVAYTGTTTTYTIATSDSNGCVHRATTEVVVSKRSPQLFPSNDTALCAGDGIRLKASNGATYSWLTDDPSSLSCLNCPDPVITPNVSGLYSAVITDPLGCSDTLSLNIEVKPLPIVTVTPKDTLVKYGRGVRLQANGANLYYWSPVASLNSPTGSSVLATVIDSATYIVTGLAENGCRNTDTAHLRVDYRDALFVPTAFTPNGDRVNDEFKISNLSFQKISEFRVFNRWGQEIFSTNDGARGWDGSWKGVEQPTGVYQYIIRIAYPDGMTETYKGDVTLIR
jgi:gliding motility-associated-like protein